MKRLALLMVMSLIVTMGIAANNKKKAQQPLKPMNEFAGENRTAEPTAVG